MKTVYWTKNYCEDLGEQDENGFYDYAYCYFSYSFRLPPTSSILARRYTDTPDVCSLFIYDMGALVNPTGTSAELLEFVSAVVEFLQVTDEIEQVEYFMGRYKTLDKNKLKFNACAFNFIRKKSE